MSEDLKRPNGSRTDNRNGGVPNRTNTTRTPNSTMNRTPSTSTGRTPSGVTTRTSSTRTGRPTDSTYRTSGVRTSRPTGMTIRATGSRSTGSSGASANRASGTQKRGPQTPEEMAKYRAYRRMKRKEKRWRKIFFLSLAAYAFLLIFLCGIFLAYESRCLVKYEKSQDYNAIDRLVKEFQKKVKDGSIRDIVEIPDSAGVFESKDSYRNLYLEKLQKVSNFTYKRNSRSYDADAPIYDIYDGENMVARMTLGAENRRTTFKILETCDWKIQSIEPVLSVSTKGYLITVPSTFKVTVNDIPLTEDHQKGEPVPVDLGLREEVLQYITLPNAVTYEVSGLVNEPTISIADSSGNPVSYEADDSGNIRVDFVMEDSGEMPKEKRDFALETAQMWADFTNRDLKGDSYGLAQIQARLVRGSYFHEYAKKYAYGVDITLVSNHHDANPKWSDISVSEYHEYNENVYSCRVKFTKHMIQDRGTVPRSISVDTTFYFVYTDDTEDGKDNPHWCMIDMMATTNN